jgi:quercetin dioxygenase-like cupin family protein
MPPIKSFHVMGERVDVLVDSAASNGVSATVVQHVPPGGGPPPHSHAREEETFTVLEGDFEILSDGQWRRLAIGEAIFSPRNSIHTFRNVGEALGRVMVFITPGGFEEYLEEIGRCSPATEMQTILDISSRYGITFHMESAKA